MSKSSVAPHLLAEGSFQSRRLWLDASLLVALVFVAYLQIGKAGFIWDDDAHVTENPCIVGPLGLVDIWTSDRARICPLVLSTFWLEFKLWGLNPVPYHWVNVAFFSANVIVLWRVLVNLQIPGAWLAAALWAVHPVQVETVAWITELKNTQSGLFYLLCIYAFIRSNNQPKIATWSFTASLLFGAMAMASKSSTVVLPLILGFCTWWQRGKLHRQDTIKLVPFFPMAAIASLVSIWTVKVEGAYNPQFTRTFTENIGLSGNVVWFYLGKLVWPEPLMFIYPRWTFDASQLAAWLPTLLLVVVLGVSWWFRNDRLRPIFMAMGCFVAALLPVLGFIDHYFLRFSHVGDHFQYLACMAPLALVAASFVKFIDRVPTQLRLMTYVLPSLLVLILLSRTWARVPVFFDDLSLWSETLEYNPDAWLAQSNLGFDLIKRGQPQKAIEHLEKSIELNPHQELTYYNLGIAYSALEDYEQAIRYFELAIQEYPQTSMFYNNLGAALRQTGRHTEAMDAFRKAISLEPENTLAARNLGKSYLALGNVALQNRSLEEAIQHYQHSLEAFPDNLEACNNLGMAYYQQRAFEKAMLHWKSALDRNPNYSEAAVNLGQLLYQLGQNAAAGDVFVSALKNSPDSPALLERFAWIRATHPSDSVRNASSAVEMAERANRIAKAQNAAILRTLAAAYAAAGRFPEAIKVAEVTIQAIHQNDALRATIENDARLYRNGSPIRDESLAPSP